MMAKRGRQQGTLTVYPSSYDGNGTVQNASRGYTSATSTSYATVVANTGYVTWRFNTSALPAGATILSASCRAKGAIGGSDRSANMVAGDTIKNTISNPSTSTQTFTFDLSSWAVEDFANIGFRALPGYILFYGATLTINYEY